MDKRLNVERKLENAEFGAKIGSVNRINPVSIYVTGKAYITPKDYDDDYCGLIDALDKDLKTITKKYTSGSQFLNNKFISNLEVSKNGIKYGKNSYLFFQLFFSQNQLNPACKNIDAIKENMTPVVKNILSEFKSKITERGFNVCENQKKNYLYKKR